MAFFNYTVEDSSPLIAYSPANAWIDASNDTLLPSYSGASYHFTTTKAASASLRFNGTGVWVFGAKRPNYGDYSITVDGTDVSTSNAGSSQNLVKQVLGTKQNMTYGTHTVIFTATSGTSRIDIDSIEVETQFPGDKITTTMIDDSDPRIQYMPSDTDWNTNSRDIFMANTLHFSQTKGASLSLPFSGESVAIYGTTSPDHADIQIEIDGRVFDTLPGGSGGRTDSLHTQVLLFYQDNLDSGQHSLNMTGVQQSTNPFIDLDAVFTYTSNHSNGTTPGGSAPSTSGAQSVPTGAIVGAAVGGTLGLILLLVLLHVLYRRRQRRLEDKESPPPLTPVLPLQQPRMSQMQAKNDAGGLSLPRPFLTHSRGSSGASSANSSTLLLRGDVPILNAAPKPPSHVRSTSSGLSPARPTQRPPTLELPG
ncbi:hypothetical protein K435DRAFT_723810 [Dendrothele bispora CBS 962.96]|uniref:Transmembrane protein n=1 Tax=Dendrothele bispora (strain CBS 962.96) TaxID=1314807 RepID=A0A4S8M0H4_DENBC|nr:hypothetical protein K435DRAFT_723810 [Dendrothele bispora CBS 962.96]